MAISATLEIAEAGKSSVLKKALKDIYTVLDLDYTFERACDLTGRPSKEALLSFIKVTIRGPKEKDTPFHKWIHDPDFLMDGEINIYDSTEFIASNIQDATGSEPVLDVNDDILFANDMMGEAMGAAMDNASDYGVDKDPDIYSEMTHDELVYVASRCGVEITAKDTDESIREKLRIQKPAYDEVNKMTDDQIIAYLNKKEVTPANNNTSEMTLPQLKKYIANNGLPGPDVTQIDKDLAEYQRYVKADMDRKDNILKAREEKAKDQKKENKKEAKKDTVHDKGVTPLYKEADNLKAKTVSASKSVAKEVTRRLGECARNITFKNAYCVSLREHFNSTPDSHGKLDKDYPWILEIGIKPQNVTVSGFQLLTGTPGTKTEFELF